MQEKSKCRLEGGSAISSVSVQKLLGKLLSKTNTLKANKISCLALIIHPLNTL